MSRTKHLNLAGLIIGFILGFAGFLLLFKIIVLDKTPPSDELAPGVVMILAIFSGITCALLGRWIQYKK